jgi:hypothetical protein
MHLAHSMEISASMCAEEPPFSSIQYLKLGDDEDPGVSSPGSGTVAGPAAPPNTPMKSSSTGRLPFERYGAQKAWLGSSGTISITPRTPATGMDGGACGAAEGVQRGRAPSASAGVAPARDRPEASVPAARGSGKLEPLAGQEP